MRFEERYDSNRGVIQREVRDTGRCGTDGESQGKTRGGEDGRETCTKRDARALERSVTKGVGGTFEEEMRGED